MQLSSEARNGIVRLFGDEGLEATLNEICNATSQEYKDRAYRLASGNRPDIVAIAQEASKAYAFENIMLILKAEFRTIQEEGQNAENSNS